MRLIIICGLSGSTNKPLSVLIPAVYAAQASSSKSRDRQITDHVPCHESYFVHVANERQRRV
jgi:hypothetical protein